MVKQTAHIRSVALGWTRCEEYLLLVEIPDSTRSASRKLRLRSDELEEARLIVSTSNAGGTPLAAASMSAS